jgi:hypothetical protein
MELELELELKLIQKHLTLRQTKRPSPSSQRTLDMPQWIRPVNAVARECWM